ncbi:hypothetical protein AVEN_171571-1 [Araneus ventricosus]|uniref:Tc1-like transposase DDE domain-containing protein n=1 Tax=Araneus ventricosus TaxID=182803 RepID=A0A4Y2W5W5_ARAVE|nr:hypothetical protein AVEN_171571-1 [Araneus ventricosus]
MLQFASSDSSAESEIAKAESMSRRNHLHDEMLGGLSMAWPARSPDLNPIEHVRDILGRRTASRSVPPGTLHEFQQILLQEWTLLPQHVINDTIARMPRRCQACISARGYHARY